MNCKFLLKLGHQGRWLFHRLRRRDLRNRSVSVVSNNCWGGFMSRWYGFPFNSPLIGLFIMADDFIRLLEEPELFNAPLTFITFPESRYPEMLRGYVYYPIGLLGGRIEIHFLHYKNEEEARAKWEKRAGRIDWNNAIIKFSDNLGATPELIERFDRLPYPNKVCFTSRPYPGLKSVVAIPRFAGAREVKSCWKWGEFVWDFVDHANNVQP